MSTSKPRKPRIAQKKAPGALQRPLPGIGPGDGKGHATAWPLPKGKKKEEQG